MTTQLLRQKILELAIRGQLVPQCPEDGTTEDLYAQIQAEKQKLIKAGKIKKEKPFPEITDEEKPFELPAGWKWVRLGDCSSYAQTKEKINAAKIPNDVWSLDLEDIEKETGRVLRRCSAGDRNITGDKVRFYKGQVLYSKLRPYLKKVLVAPDYGICSSEMIPFSVYAEMVAQYFVYVLTSPYVDSIVNSVAYGVKMPRVGTETMTNLPIPLPPLAEQKRIVAKVEELLREVDAIEKAQEAMKKTAEQMKRKLLELAIQGKLLPQNPNDEPASVLLERIREEKKKLIAEGKIKKDKNESVIFMRDNSPYEKLNGVERSIADEVPFELPNGWAWCRLGDLCNVQTGKKDANFGSKDGSYPFFTCAQEPIRSSSYSFDTEAVLLAGNGDISNISYYEGKFEAYQRTYVLSKKVNEALDFHYLYWHLKCNWVAYNLDKMYGTAIPYIRLGNLIQYPIALPPLAEQTRIVKKLEQLFSAVKDL